MVSWQDPSDFETLLAQERPRLVRLCAWFTGSPEAAEDLAQETLIAAWKRRARLISPEKLRPWTSAIARNVCLNWSRQWARERMRVIAEVDDPEGGFEETLPSDVFLDYELDRQELAHLLDRALALLPAETAQLLIAHYIQETPHAEIAAKLGIQTGTVAVRLQRGRLTLQKLLQNNLHEEAVAFGLIAEDAAHWQKTNIWCPMCGKNHLMGQYQQGEGSGRFALRCPSCQADPDKIMAGMDLSIPHHAQLLEGVKAFKPAYNRLRNFTAGFFRQALANDQTACPACGGEIVLRVEHEKAIQAPPYLVRMLLAHCLRCGWATNSNLTGIVMALPEAQQFWRENPRIHALPAEMVESQGSPAFVTRLQSLTTAAQLVVISRRDTLETLSVHIT